LRYRVSNGKTLLIDGPACVHLISGSAEVLGAEIKPEGRIIIRQGKRLPFEANPEFEAEVFMGEQASCKEINESAIPQSWRRTVTGILSEKKRATVLILGGVDSGKSSFSIYLINSALKANLRVAFIDCDLGQTDLGPPGTISLCFIKNPVTDLFKIFPDDSVFIGVTSPSGVINDVLNAAAKLKGEALTRDVDLLVINTDGWIDGDDAISYKVRLVETVNPECIVAIQSSDVLNPLLSKLNEKRIITIDQPGNIKRRDRDTRRLLREFSYKKHLRGSKIRVFPFSWIYIEGYLRLNSKGGDQLRERMREILKTEILGCGETHKSIVVVLRKDAGLDEKAVKRAEAETGKRIILLREGDERGLLTSLESSSGKMLGIGTIHCIDYNNMAIKICTPVNEAVSKIKVGRIKLDSEGNEEGILF